MTFIDVEVDLYSKTEKNYYYYCWVENDVYLGRNKNSWMCFDDTVKMKTHYRTGNKSKMKPNIVKRIRLTNNMKRFGVSGTWIYLALIINSSNGIESKWIG